ncbi:MAG TPA: hypothetical protein DEO56_09595 [Nitrosomonas nitrosa]|nr:hypothetical protein [Nitrosomonas nitrosa]HNP52928.1 hypothetical protein [Nitrosomonas nitrosa]
MGRKQAVEFIQFMQLMKPHSNLVDMEIVGIEAHGMMVFHNQPPRESLPFLIPWAPSKYGRIIFLRSS